MSELGKPGDQMHTIVIMWTQDGTLGSNANVTLQGDVVVGKAQFGLR